MLRRHPPVHQRTRTPRAAKVLHPGRVRMVRLPSRQFDQRLILFRLLPLKTIHPGKPPVPTITLVISAHIARITLAISHRRFPLAENTTPSANLLQANGPPTSTAHPHSSYSIHPALADPGQTR
jgi:hypothetical protein